MQCVVSGAGVVVGRCEREGVCVHAVHGEVGVFLSHANVPVPVLSCPKQNQLFPKEAVTERGVRVLTIGDPGFSVLLGRQAACQTGAELKSWGGQPTQLPY